MRTEVELFDDVAALAADAGGALSRASQPRLYDRIDWIALTAAHLPLRPLLAARARCRAGAAWLFLQAPEAGRAEGFARWYTPAFAPVFAPGTADDAKAALLAAIARHLRGRVHRIWLHPCDDRAVALLDGGFGAAGWRALTTPDTVNWTADVRGMNHAGFQARRPGHLRGTLRRKARAGIACTVHAGFSPGAWRAYEGVYAESWKPREGAPGFLRALAEQEGAAGTLRLGLAHHAGRAVAAQLWTVENGRATIHKLAHVADADALSPGTILTDAMMARAIDGDRVDMIDFGTGDEPYKAGWMDVARPLRHVELFDVGTIRGRLAHGAALVARALRR